MTSQKKEKKTITPKMSLGYAYFIVAAVFLFNPTINVIDILPDFFGYVFLIKGLSKWADLCPNISDAMAGIGRLRWFMLMKMLSMVLVPFVDDTYVLIFVFAFGVIELMYALPAASRIFDGLEYFGTRFDCKVIFKGPAKVRKVNLEKNGKIQKAPKPPRYAVGIKDIRLLTSIFFIIKTAVCVLPELCSLSSYEYSGIITNGVQVNFANYKGFLVELNLVIGTFIGVLWLVSLISYVNRISKDTPFLARVLNDYNIEIGQNIGIAIRRNLRTSITLIIAGLVFFPNMWLDGVNVIPTFIGAIFIIAAMGNLRRMAPVPKSSVVVPTIFALISAVSFALSLYFGVFYRIGDVYRNFETYDLFNIMRIVSVIEYVGMIAVGCIICRELRRIVRMHLCANLNITDNRLVNMHTQSQREENRAITTGFIAFIVAAVVNVAYLVLRADIAADFWVVAFLAMVIWIVYMASTMNRLYEQIEYKYL